MAKAELVLAGEAFDVFVKSLKSEATKAQYTKAIKTYMQFLKVDRITDLLSGDPKMIQARIISFVVEQKEKGLSTSLIQMRLAGIKHFYSMNDITGLNWDKIYSFLGESTRKHKNRPYTRSEIQKLLSLCNYPRDRMIILLMVSSGMRVGALPDLKVRHLTIIEKYRIYRITVYEGTNDEYLTFCTPECTNSIDSWLEYRRRAGEKIIPESYLIREQFDINDSLQVARPKRIKENSIQFFLHEKMIQAGIRQKVNILEGQEKHKGSIRHEVRLSHGMRKMFHTVASQAGVHHVGQRGGVISISTPMKWTVLEPALTGKVKISSSFMCSTSGTT